MPITLVDTRTGSSNNGQDVLILLPAMTQGDRVLVFGGHGYRSTAAVDPITTGYTRHLLRGSFGFANGDPHVGFWSKEMGVTPDTQVSLPGSGAGQDATAYVIYCLRGVDSTTPLDASIQSVESMDPPSITTQTAGAWTFAFGARKNDTSLAVLSGYSNFLNASVVDTNRLTVGCCLKEVAIAGAEDPATYDPSTSSPYSATIAIRPAGGQITTVNASDASSVSITESSGLSITNAPQRLFPDGDGTIVGVWTGTWQDVDEPIPNDLDFISSSTNPAVEDFYTVTLANPQLPLASGDHIIKIRYSKDADAGRDIALAAQLRQGDGTIIAQLDLGILTSSTWQTSTYTLTPQEVANIVDYNDIRFRFNPTASGGGAGRAARISGVELEVPAQQAVTPIVGSDSASLAISESTLFAKSDSKATNDTGSLTINDTSSSSITLPGTETRSLSIIETASIFKTSSTTDSGSLSVNDISTTLVNRSSSDTASVAISEATARANGIVGSDTASLTISETNTRFVTKTATDASAVSIGDTASSFRTRVGTDQSTITITETAAVGGEASLPGQESFAIGIVEQRTIAVTVSRTDTSSIAISDASAIILTQPKSASDTQGLSITEATTLSKQPAASDASGFGITETVALQKNIVSSDALSLSASESRAVSVSLVRTDAATVAISEDRGREVALTISDIGSLAIVEQATILATREAADASTIQLVDAGSLVQTTISTTLYIHDGMDWKQGNMFIYTNNEWRATKVYIRDESQWK